MQQRYIKQIVKNKLHRGNKNSRNHYRISKTQAYKTLIGNRIFKLSIRDNNNGIDDNTLQAIKEHWVACGYTLKDFNKVGTIKALNILKNY